MIALLLTGLMAQTTDDFSVEAVNRLALTPKLNGVLEADEWDTLSVGGGMTSFLQWEPGSLYIAGRVPAEQSARISLDLAQDGWLVGDDNLEITLSPEVRVRRLVQDTQEGARWVEEPLIARMIRAQAVPGADGWTFEMQWLSLESRLFQRNRQFNVRVEATPRDGLEAAAFLPRRTQPVRLAFDRARGLPDGMEWRPDHDVRTVIPGEGIKLRLTFVNKGDGQVGRVDLRTFGFASLFTGQKNLPFPRFDSKRRAFVDYEANVVDGAPLGFTRLIARLVRNDGQEAVIESSYQIADRISVTPELRVEKGEAGTPRIIRGDVILKSNTTASLRGKMFLDLPEGWALRRGNNADFRIWRARGEARMRVELVSPQGVSGLVPVPIRVQLGEKAISHTAYLVIE